MQLSGYDISGTLGDGGMATVYRGTQLSLDRPVAIKVLKSNLLKNSEVRERFERESKIIARLNHPNIISVIDQGVTDSGSPFFVMEFVKSISLKTALVHKHTSVSRALNIFVQIAKALAYAHKNNVIHCDIKPDNILVDFEGYVRVLDFGIAQIFDKEKGARKNIVMGSPAYMAPEQHESISAATEKSDLYALGVIMHQYFSQVGEIQEGFDRAQIDSIVQQCLANAPENRPSSADEVRQRLLRILGGSHLKTQQKQRAATDVKKTFSILDVLKEDKYGAVYLFEEQGSHKLFVVKKKPATSPGFDIAKRLSRVQHHNIAKVYGASKNQRVFIQVSEYCPSGALSDRLLAPYRLNEFILIARQIVDALIAGHNAGIVHGNLRPSNILFDSNQAVKVCDFGLEEHYAGGAGGGQENWYTPGTEVRSELTDIYAAGVIFYQMLTSHLPNWRFGKLVKGKSFQQHPKEVREIVQSMLQHNPKARTQRLRDVADQLAKLDETSYTEVRIIDYGDANRAPQEHSPQPFFNKRRIVLGIFFFAALAIAALQAVIIYNY